MGELFKVECKEKVHGFIEKNYGIDRGGNFIIPQFEGGSFSFSHRLPQWIVEKHQVDVEAWRLIHDEYDITYHDKSGNMAAILCVPSQNYYCVSNLGRKHIKKKDEKEEILKRLEKAKQFFFTLCVSIQEKRSEKP